MEMQEQVVNYDGVMEQWKVELIIARARRMGFRPDEMPDVLQQIVWEVLKFQFDVERSNGAKESTALQAIVDNHLKKICRTIARYRAHLERFGAEQTQETDFAAEERAVDIRTAIAQLSQREQAVCEALLEGSSRNEIAQRLGCGWHTVDRLIGRIREHFEQSGLGGYLFG